MIRNANEGATNRKIVEAGHHEPIRIRLSDRPEVVLIPLNMNGAVLAIESDERFEINPTALTIKRKPGESFTLVFEDGASVRVKSVDEGPIRLRIAAAPSVDIVRDDCKNREKKPA